VGIGLEEFGLEDFVKGEYFGGDLYLDTKKTSYAALGYRRYSLCDIIMSILSKAGRDAISKGRASGMESNLRGDGMQSGGLLIVKKGGNEVLFSYKQDNPAEHAANADILKALNISDLPPDSKSDSISHRHPPK